MQLKKYKKIKTIKNCVNRVSNHCHPFCSEFQGLLQIFEKKPFL